MNVQVELAPQNKKGGLLLKNPVMTAAGTFGYGIEYGKITETERLGAIICKGTTLHHRAGNRQPRTCETASGMLNAIGLQNPGIRTVIERYAPMWAKWKTPVIVNIAGETMQEFVELAGQLEDVPGIAGVEVNVSCPNIIAGGTVFGDSAETVAEVTARVRRATTLPLIVKLSPNTGDCRPTALAAAASGADAVSLINTITGIAIDIQTRRPALGNSTGGLSGPAIKPIALRMVYDVACALRDTYPNVPVIGIGGISNTQVALEFLMAGASAIQVGTINFVNPRAGVEIVEGIAAFMEREGISDVREIIGCAL
jgi:dihydroorotate dehydrogenase (NAD+) catalytic subunit